MKTGVRTDYFFFDFVWLAVDADYHVAAFTTGGAGPVLAPRPRSHR